LNGRTACEACTHIASFHVERTGPCRVADCDCSQFLHADIVDEDEAQTRPRVRRVAVDVPDGYTLSITLIPVEPGHLVEVEAAVEVEADDAD
jgi:hypothetical protein